MGKVNVIIVDATGNKEQKVGLPDDVKIGIIMVKLVEKINNILSPYYENALAVVYKDGTAVNSLDDLKGKKIAAQLGTTGADLAHKIEGTTVKEFDHSNEALLELQNSGVDATVIDLPVAQYYSTKHPDQHIKFMAYPNTKEYLGLAINKDNKALQEEINKAIADMKADGEFNTLYKKWFNVDAPADMPVVVEFK